LTVFADDLLSPVYVGWTRGYLDEQRAAFEQALAAGGELADWAERVRIAHPRAAFQALAADLRGEAGAAWMA